jgi:MFS family permease
MPLVSLDEQSLCTFQTCGVHLMVLDNPFILSGNLADAESFVVIIPMTVISGCLAFAFLGAHSDGGLLVFAILYGFFSGGFVSVSAPASASFSRNLGEVGYVFHVNVQNKRLHQNRTRIGLMTFVSSFGLLTGNPISGAILDPPRYSWIQPIVFSGVCLSFT